jgi:hypothetical protein
MGQQVAATTRFGNQQIVQHFPFRGFLGVAGGEIGSVHIVMPCFPLRL